MQTASNLSNVLLIDDLSELSSEVGRGSSIERQIRIQNFGDQRIELNLWIEPTDTASEPLWRWCSFSDPTLTLEEQASRSITLTFEVPQQATAGLYSYELLAEAAAQYPGKTIRRPQQLRVVSSDLDTVLDSTPGLTVEPVTSAVKPQGLNANQTIEFTIRVENRSKRVDRFFLRCPDLPESWYEIHYPEDRPRSGIVSETNGLELNPGRTGEIKLTLHPPQYTSAAYYQPTIRLISKNTPSLLLLDVIYLQVHPDVRLQVELHPAARHIPEEQGRFEVKLFNPGNFPRHLMLGASDPEQLFSYGVNPEAIVLQPGEEETFVLHSKRRKWWRRPLWGKGLRFSFDLLLQNVPLETRPSPEIVDSEAPPQEPSLPETMPQGTILWQPRAWWELLLLTLLCLGLLGAITFAVWRILFWHPQPLPPPPAASISHFGVAQTLDAQGKLAPVVYQEGGNTPLRLDWAIRNFKDVNKITIVQMEADREVYRKSYFFSPDANRLDQYIPPHLQKLDPQGNLKSNNFCEITQAESFGFPSLTIASQIMGDRFRLPQQLPVPASPTVLECRGIVTPVKQAGNYVFKMEVFSKPLSPDIQQKTEPRSRWERWFDRPPTLTIPPTATLTTDTLQILPPLPLPTIVSFAPAQPIYREAGAAPPSPPANGKPQPSPLPIQLNWEIANPKQIKELRLVSVTATGAIERVLSRYPVTNGMPAALSASCTIAANLVCRDVPVPIETVGSHQVKLIIVPTLPQSAQAAQNSSSTAASAGEIAAVTPPIQVQARSPIIKSFRVNGQEAAAQPKQVYTVSQARAPVAIQLSWEVENGTVQLLPAPGAVQPEGKMTYLAATPSREAITLQATNESGETVTQTIVIEIMEFEPPDTATPSAGSSGSVSGSASGSSPPSSPPPTPSNPDALSPIELPPRVN